MNINRKKMLTIVLIATAVILLAGGALGYIYFCTDVLKSGQELFAKYVSQELNEIEPIISRGKINQINEKLEQSKYEEKMTISYIEEEETTTELTIDSQKDNSEEKTYMHMSLKKEGIEEPLELEYMQEKDAYSVRFTSISKDLEFITIENKNLKKVAENLGIDKDIIEEIPNKINWEEFSLEGLNFTEQEKKEEIDKYISVIYNNIPKERYTKNKDVVITVKGQTITTNAYVLTLTEQDINNIVIKLLEELKNDEIIVSKLSILVEKMKTLDTSMEELDEETLRDKYKETIQELIDTLKESNITDEKNIIITVYEDNGKTVRIKLEQELDYITVDSAVEGEKKQLDINFTSIDEENTQLSYKVTFLKENANKSKIQITNIKGEEQEKSEYSMEIVENEDGTKLSYLITDTESNKMSITREIKFVDEIEYEVELDETNNIILNDLNKEQVEIIKNILEPRINSSYIEKIDKISTDEIITITTLSATALIIMEPEKITYAVPIISTALITVRSGMEVMSGADMSEAEKEAFNSKFTSYEGLMVPTSRVNQLMALVVAHNDQEGQKGTNRYVEVSGNATLDKDTHEIPRLLGNKYYQIICKYNDGYIYEIIIANPEDEILTEENREVDPEVNNEATNNFWNTVLDEGNEFVDSENNMSETEKEVFNSKFLSYEGSNVSASDVNALLSTVLTSNSSDEKKIIVTIDENVVLDENSDYISRVEEGKYYQVECKLENGIVTKIEITEK